MFSGTVAAFLLTSYFSLLPDNNERTITILAQISRQLDALSNREVFPISPTFDTFTFNPGVSTVVVNVLWAMSLALSLTSALLATLMQQWIRRYNQVYRRSQDLRTQALTREYFADGTDKHYMSFTVALLPAIVHASVVLFFMGFAIFLFAANRTVSYPLIATLLLCTIGYLILTFSSFRSYNSPYQTPLTSPFWISLQAARLSLAWLFGCWRDHLDKHKAILRVGMQSILDSGAKVTFDNNERDALKWTLDHLRHDNQIEEFVDAVPSVLISGNTINSEMTSVLGPPLNKAVWRLLETCKGYNLSKGARKQRLTACYRTIWCLEDMSLGHTEDLLEKWRSSRRDSVEEEWDVLCFEAWKVAQQRTKIQSNKRLALLAECSQALLAMLWAIGRYSTTRDEIDEARHILQVQLGYPPPIPQHIPLHPSPSNLTVAITVCFLKRALSIISVARAPDDIPNHIRLIFSKAAKSFGEKALGIPEDDAYQNMMQSKFPEWRNHFITLSSSLRLSDDQKFAFPYITFNDIHKLYQISGQSLARLHFTDGPHLSFPLPCLRAVGVWCCVKLVCAVLVDFEKPRSGGELSRPSGALDACWGLVHIMEQDQDRKVVFRSFCIRTMLTVEWLKAGSHASSSPSGSRPETTVATTPHLEVSGKYITKADRDTIKGDHFPLVAANKLLDDLINEQCIAELKDMNVADDFEKTLQHVLGRYLSSADPQLDPTLENQGPAFPSGPEKKNLKDTLRRVRLYAEKQDLARITSFIDNLGIMKEVPKVAPGPANNGRDDADNGRDVRV